MLGKPLIDAYRKQQSILTQKFLPDRVSEASDIMQWYNFSQLISNYASHCIVQIPDIYIPSDLILNNIPCFAG